MEELRDASIHHTAIKLFSDIKCMKLYDSLYQTVQVPNKYSFALPCSSNHNLSFYYCIYRN